MTGTTINLIDAIIEEKKERRNIREEKSDSPSGVSEGKEITHPEEKSA